MDFSTYINADKLQEIEAKLQSIHPSLHIGGITSCKGVASRVDVIIKVGGNKGIIDKLLATGWNKCIGYRGKGHHWIVLQKDV